MLSPKVEAGNADFDLHHLIFLLFFCNVYVLANITLFVWLWPVAGVYLLLLLVAGVDLV